MRVTKYRARRVDYLVLATALMRVTKYHARPFDMSTVGSGIARLGMPEKATKRPLEPSAGE